jgi:hypothetical protein
LSGRINKLTDSHNGPVICPTHVEIGQIGRKRPGAGGDLIRLAKLKANVIAMFGEILTLMIKIIPFAEPESAI